MLGYTSILCCRCRGTEMKRAHISGVMWLLIFLVQAFLSISDLAKTNDTTSVCDGSLQECLNARHLDTQFPTVSSSHFARMLAQADTKTANFDDRKMSCPIRENRYKDCYPPMQPGNVQQRCDELFKRDC
ncbi:hypothetical protein VNO80_08072 [Phaseolus coccineus]|uniref:Uncharacterized protein n=1 Tax=Phaseolus coccineus TaxID=3886 RepID=A0AAN9NLE3_PHACN